MATVNSTWLVTNYSVTDNSICLYEDKASTTEQLLTLLKSYKFWIWTHFHNLIFDYCFEIHSKGTKVVFMNLTTRKAQTVSGTDLGIIWNILKSLHWKIKNWRKGPSPLCHHWIRKFHLLSQYKNVFSNIWKYSSFW